MAGRSVMPLARGEVDHLHQHVVVQYDDFCWSIVDRAGAKLIRYDSDPEGVGELYLLDDDPYEHRNRWDDPALAAVKAGLLTQLTTWREANGAVPA